MLSQLLFVRLRAAEKALRAGRLNEAYRLASAPDIREHRRGTAVLAALTERFIERARAHFRDDRFAEALLDLEKAHTGGVAEKEVAELRQHIQTVVAEQQRREESHRNRIETARRRIRGGSLVAGRRILEQAGEHDPDAGKLRREIDNRGHDVRQMAQQAEQWIAQGRFAAAAERLRKARALDSQDPQVAAVETTLCSRVLQTARAAIVEGRLGRASDELASLGSLGGDLPARRELDDALARACEAAANLQHDQYAEARRQAMSLKRLVPEAKWIDTSIDRLRQLEEIRTTLAAGPLGERIDPVASQEQHPKPDRGLQVVRPFAQVKAHGTAPEDTVVVPMRGGPTVSLPTRLLLLVDGGGSYLLLCGGRATIGRASSENQADIAVISDLAECHAHIQRVDDDYFLFSTKPVEVAGRQTRHHLLRDGDRIVLGRKAKLTFRLPTRKSSTAVLDLSDTTKMSNDVRRVVLFAQQATVGDGPHAHIRCRHAGPPLVLFERSGRLWIRQRSDGHVDNEAHPLRFGEPVEIGGAGLVLQRWQVRPPGLTNV